MKTFDGFILFFAVIVKVFLIVTFWLLPLPTVAQISFTIVGMIEATLLTIKAFDVFQD